MGELDFDYPLHPELNVGEWGDIYISPINPISKHTIQTRLNEWGDQNSLKKIGIFLL